MTRDPAVIALHVELTRHLGRIAKLFKNPKITLVVRSPDLPNAGVVIGDDDPLKAIEEIQKLVAHQPTTATNESIER